MLHWISRRALSLSGRRGFCAAYDGPGKTTVSILNEDSSTLMIDSYNTTGFRLNNSIKAFGPIVLFPKGIFGWVVRNASEINENSLCIFDILKPTPEIIIIGYGSPDAKLDPRIILRLKHSMKLNIEALPTKKAVTTYNFLSSEGRNVAGAFIPPSYVDIPSEMDKSVFIPSTEGEDIFDAMK
eukprot:TRINITY_DN1635_c0_g1_i2.p1 TRINITY_DN1635_c0_g1~~TRINITY_DN1635_c0_g1_i2.p1  ORF type:complete len:183 (-),score=45.79 TRINITY_DN1635_c0_g1_i2:143-691(-)